MTPRKLFGWHTCGKVDVEIPRLRQGVVSWLHSVRGLREKSGERDPCVSVNNETYWDIVFFFWNSNASQNKRKGDFIALFQVVRGFASNLEVGAVWAAQDFPGIWKSRRLKFIAVKMQIANLQTTSNIIKQLQLPKPNLYYCIFFLVVVMMHLWHALDIFGFGQAEKQQWESQAQVLCTVMACRDLGVASFERWPSNPRWKKFRKLHDEAWLHKVIRMDLHNLQIKFTIGCWFILVHVGSCWHVGSLVTFGKFPQELRGETRELRRRLEGLEVGSGTDLRPGNMWNSREMSGKFNDTSQISRIQT